MSIGRDTIDLLIKLRASGHLAAHAAVLEVGTQQLSEDFLTNQEKLAQLAAIFGIKNPSFVPSQGELTHLAGNAGRARDFWLWLGFDYTVVDVDGNPDLIRLDPRDFWLWLGFDYSLQGSPSSITLDLNYDSAPPYATQKYDLVTNFGTTEHVANQLNAFRVIHNLTKPGGIMIYQMPAQGSPTHGLINYNLKFFWILAKSNGYRICMPIGLRPKRRMTRQIPLSIFSIRRIRGPATLDFEAGDAGMTLVMEKARDTPFVAPIDPPRAAPTTAIRVPNSVNWSLRCDAFSVC